MTEAEDARQQSLEEINKAKKDASDAIYEARQQSTEQITKVKENTATQIAAERKKLSDEQIKVTDMIQKTKEAEQSMSAQKKKLEDIQTQVKAAQVELKPLTLVDYFIL